MLHYVHTLLRSVKLFLIFKIATLSPADICYEESLSTLRYAERYDKKFLNRVIHHECMNASG